MSWPDGEFSDLQALKNALPTDNKFHFDKAEFCGHEINKGQTSMRGIFSAPKSGTYSFQVKASYSARLYVDGVSIYCKCAKISNTLFDTILP